MLRLLLFLLFISATVQPTFAKNKKIYTNSSLTFYSKHFLGAPYYISPSKKGLLKHNIKYRHGNLTSNLGLNYDGYNKFNITKISERNIFSKYRV